jgi:hypothetical protein
MAGSALFLAAVIAVSPFADSTRCMACHNGIVTPSGEDVSIGSDWRSSMMANAARDPYWHAAVRRETLDHPAASEAIQNECSACHMPMMRYEAKTAGARGQVFVHLPVGAPAATPAALLAADGVSCTVCHRIAPDAEDRFNAGFTIDATRAVFGGAGVTPGHARIMSSATTFVPTESPHLRSSSMCASCHTLYTHALDEQGRDLGAFPEQVPFLEWRHSSYRGAQSCASCHTPLVKDALVPFTSVLGTPRPNFARHQFRGGNFFMARLFARHARQLGVAALPQELELSAQRTLAHLESETAAIAIENAAVDGGILGAEIVVTNFAGHKLPTAYPSRRVWLHLRVRDATGAIVFESGRPNPDGSIAGNDNDADPLRFEPHHAAIASPGDVQIYESIMADAKGNVTTGLLSAVRYVKDNRVLPRGFDKASAHADVRVRGEAMDDVDFVGGSDRIRCAIDVREARGPLRLEAVLLYQSIAFRWAHNLRSAENAEGTRFAAMYDAMAAGGVAVLARSEAIAGE